MKTTFFTLLAIIFFEACSQNKSSIPLSKMDNKTFKEVAKAELSKIDSFQINKSDSLGLLISKANELNFCDSIIVIGAKGDEESRDISARMDVKIYHLKDRALKILRINYAVEISRYLTKKFGYETFANPWYGNDPCNFLILRSDGFFNKEIVNRIFEDIKLQLELFGFIGIKFTSKEKYWHQYQSGGFWDYGDKGHYEIK